MEKNKETQELYLISVYSSELNKLLRDKGIQEYMSGREDLREYLDPLLSYPYIKGQTKEGYRWLVTSQEGDPPFMVTLVEIKQGHVLDFFWPTAESKRFEKPEMLVGKHYLDTLSKIITQEIEPLLRGGKVERVIFTPYSKDGRGVIRKKVFLAIIDKFLDKTLYQLKNFEETYYIEKIKQE